MAPASKALPPLCIGSSSLACSTCASSAASGTWTICEGRMTWDIDHCIRNEGHVWVGSQHYDFYLRYLTWFLQTSKYNKSE